jgi:hypothetical protein
MEDERSRFWMARHPVWAILAASAILKLALVLATGDSVYGDVGIALRFGRRAVQDGLAGDGGLLVINSKTLLGPIAWSWIHAHAGVAGLKAVNLACFLALFALQHALGRKAYSLQAVAVALFLFAFYVGTNLNVVAGEQDDMVCALLIATGVLLHVRTGGTLSASLLLGLAFLFKFTAAVFWVGFAAYLLVRRRSWSLLLAGAGAAAPFILFNLLTGGSGLASLERSLEIQRAYSTWTEVGFKLLSTGMALSVLVSAWMVWRDPAGHDVLFFCLSAAYLPYVVIMRDAFSASYVMMTCMVFASFPIARFLLDRKEKLAHGRSLLLGALLAYLVATTGITVHNLVRDTRPLAARVAATADGPRSAGPCE